MQQPLKMRRKLGPQRCIYHLFYTSIRFLWFWNSSSNCLLRFPSLKFIAVSRCRPRNFAFHNGENCEHDDYPTNESLAFRSEPAENVSRNLFAFVLKFSRCDIVRSRAGILVALIQRRSPCDTFAKWYFVRTRLFDRDICTFVEIFSVRCLLVAVWLWKVEFHTKRVETGRKKYLFSTVSRWNAFDFAGRSICLSFFLFTSIPRYGLLMAAIPFCFGFYFFSMRENDLSSLLCLPVELFIKWVTRGELFRLSGILWKWTFRFIC